MNLELTNKKIFARLKLPINEDIVYGIENGLTYTTAMQEFIKCEYDGRTLIFRGTKTPNVFQYYHEDNRNYAYDISGYYYFKKWLILKARDIEDII